jgi:hypothetical protein
MIFLSLSYFLEFQLTRKNFSNLTVSSHRDWLGGTPAMLVDTLAWTKSKCWLATSSPPVRQLTATPAFWCPRDRANSLIRTGTQWGVKLWQWRQELVTGACSGELYHGGTLQPSVERWLRSTLRCEKMCIIRASSPGTRGRAWRGR